MKQMHLPHFSVDGCEAFRDARCSRSPVSDPTWAWCSPQRRGSSPGTEARSESMVGSSRKRENTTWAEMMVTHFFIHLLALNPVTLGRPLAGFGIALQSGMCGHVFFDCSQCKRHLLPGLCLRALLTAFLTSYF